MIIFANRRQDRTRTRAIASALLLLAATGAPLAAQERAAEKAPGCLDTLSTSAFVRVPIYLEAQATDSLGRAVLPAADSFAIRVAAMVRSSISESATSLPEGEMLLHWRAVGGSVRIALHRDGPFTWSTPRREGEDSLSAPSKQLLAGSVAALRSAGAKIGWPPDVAGDSVTFDLVPRWAYVAPDGTVQSFAVRSTAIPMFSMGLPRTVQVVERYMPKLTYPPEERNGMIEATVILHFVVDSTGRVAANTIRDKWPPDRPRLTGWRGSRYESFLRAAKSALSGARFEPARVGGCPVPQFVEQAFNFTLKH